MGSASAPIHGDLQNILSSQVPVMDFENLRTRTITNLERKPENQRTVVTSQAADNSIDTRAYADVERLSWPDIFSSSPQCLETGHLSFDPWGPFPGMWDLRLPELAIDEKLPLVPTYRPIRIPPSQNYRISRRRMSGYLFTACMFLLRQRQVVLPFIFPPPSPDFPYFTHPNIRYKSDIDIAIFRDAYSWRTVLWRRGKG